MNYNDLFLGYVSLAEEKLNTFIKLYKNDVPENIYSAVEYAVSGGGKRVRPVLLFAVADSIGVDKEKLYGFAVAIELIHSYSLVHDDLPAMDNDDYRRGKLSTHKKFGEALGILTGDALLNMSFDSMLSSISDKIGLECAKNISNFAGVLGMIKGQVLDMDTNKECISEELLYDIYLNKTAKLIMASVLTPAFYKKEYFDVLKEYGENLGCLFQITDDILDEESSLEVLGKTPKKDFEQNKLTAIKLFGLDGAKKRATMHYNKCVCLLNQIPNNQFLLKFTELIMP